MKKIITLLFVTALLLTSCSGEDGRDGLDAPVVNFFETSVNFNSQKDFSEIISIPNSITVSGFDVIQVYILWDQDNKGNDVWRALSQVRQLNQGDLIYNFDYTSNDVRLFLEANFDLNTLQSGDTQNQVFRIAVIPSYQAKNMNINDINAVMKAAKNTVEKIN